MMTVTPITDDALAAIKARFERLVFPEPMSGCWLWLGAANVPEEGRLQPVFTFNGRQWLAHRASVWLFKGPFERSAFVCHHCDNSMCVNPDHLYVGNHRSNMDDMVRRKRSAMARDPVYAMQISVEAGRKNTWSKGRNNPNAKLTADDVAAICSDPRGPVALAKVYGVNRGTITAARRAFLDLPANDPTARAALDRLANAEDALMKGTAK